MKNIPTESTRIITQFLPPNEKGYINKQFQKHAQIEMRDYINKMLHEPLRSKLLYLLKCIRFLEKPRPTIASSNKSNQNLWISRASIILNRKPQEINNKDIIKVKLLGIEKNFPAEPNTKRFKRIIQYIKRFLDRHPPALPAPSLRITIDDINLLVEYQLL